MEMKLFRNPSKEVRKLSLVKIITGIDRKFNWPIIIYTNTSKYIMCETTNPFVKTIFQMISHNVMFKHNTVLCSFRISFRVSLLL